MTTLSFDTFDQPEVRFPRGVVKANGVPVVGWKSVEVNNNGYFQADTFRVAFAIAGLPSGYGLDYWSSTVPIQIEVMVGLLGAGDGQVTPSDLTSLILGNVDQVDVDLARGTIEASGRDRTADFIDAKTSNYYPTQTSSEIAALLAANHGLQTQITDTTTQVGDYYKTDSKVKTTGDGVRETTEWNLLTYLAQFEGFDVFVQGNTLHFEPTASDSAQPYNVTVQQGQAGLLINAEDLHLSRNLTLAKDVIVTVISFNQKKGAVFKSTAKAQKADRSQAQGGQGQAYLFRFPNMDQQQVTAKAQQLVRQITLQERLINFTSPADLALTARARISLSGTGSGWDQSYFVDEIERKLSFDPPAFSMSVRGKNHSPQSTVLA